MIEVWAPRRDVGAAAPARATSGSPLEPRATAGARHPSRWRDGDEYGFVLDDAPSVASRSAIAAPAARRARAQRVVRPRRVRLARRRVDRSPARRLGRSTSCTSAPSPPRARSTPRSERLDHLVDLGIGFVELLPVNAFNGTHNWGYDGVLWYAVHEGYGGPARVSAVRRRLPPARARRHPGRRLQPPRSERQLPAGVRPLPARRRAQRLGLVDRSRRGRGAPLHRRERADVDARLPRRRAATGCRACAQGLVAAAHPAGARRGRPTRSAPTSAARSPSSPSRTSTTRRSSPRARPAATGSRRSGATTTTTPCTSR